jgi:hypothetical protein
MFQKEPKLSDEQLRLRYMTIRGSNTHRIRVLMQKDIHCQFSFFRSKKEAIFENEFARLSCSACILQISLDHICRLVKIEYFRLLRFKNNDVLMKLDLGRRLFTRSRE